jgi:hypothetical protein
VCVVVDGAAYLVGVDAPEGGVAVVHGKVRRVVSAVSNQLMLVVSHYVIVAVDALQVLRIDPYGIHCTADMFGT